VAVDNPPGYLGYLYPGIAIADNTVEITDTEYPASLLGFSQATGGSGWPQKTIGT
jgi:hypothetical protein